MQAATTRTQPPRSREPPPICRRSNRRLPTRSTAAATARGNAARTAGGKLDNPAAQPAGASQLHRAPAATTTTSSRALGKHHLSIQPHHQTSEASARHRQTIVHRGAGGSGIPDGRARGAGASRGHSSRHREVESHSNAGGNAGWLGHDARRSAHRGGASVRQQHEPGPGIARRAGRSEEAGRVFLHRNAEEEAGPAVGIGGRRGAGDRPGGLRRHDARRQARRERGDPRSFAGGGYLRWLAARGSWQRRPPSASLPVCPR